MGARNGLGRRTAARAAGGASAGDDCTARHLMLARRGRCLAGPGAHSQASNPVDGDLNDVGRVCALGRIEILPVNGNGAAGMRYDVVPDAPEFRHYRAVFSLPLDPVVDHAAATVRGASLRVDTERNAEFVLAQAHDERVLNQ